MTTIQIQWQHVLDNSIQGEVEATLPLHIGRATDNELVLNDYLKSVSRHHALLTDVDGAIVLKDVGSMNGVQVNGRSITYAVLPNKAQFTVGAFALTMMVQQQTHRVRAIKSDAPPKCSNHECGREVATDAKMCPWCGRFMADAITTEKLFA